MKKNAFLTVRLTVIFTFGLLVIGCVSTVKLSPELNKENAAIFLIDHKTRFVDTTTNTLYDGGVWSLKVKEIDGKSVDWKQYGKETIVLMPPGEHVLECWLQSQSIGCSIIQSIRVNLEPKNYYLRSDIYQNNDYRSRSELFKNMDDLFYFSLSLNNSENYQFTYKNTPQFYKDYQEGKSTVSLDTISVVLDSNKGREIVSVKYNGTEIKNKYSNAWHSFSWKNDNINSIRLELLGKNTSEGIAFFIGGSINNEQKPLNTFDSVEIGQSGENRRPNKFAPIENTNCSFWTVESDMTLHFSIKKGSDEIYNIILK
ncbi:hypothetical protein R84B8_02758 [Treponema sp. R8-4-B8]